MVDEGEEERVILAGALDVVDAQLRTQLSELGLAFVLASAIGLERELRQKSAGLRTHTLVGVGAALFVLVSKYGFADVIVAGRVVLDPSRVAAQVVSGIGFIGGGLIFLRRDAVRGLTTAAVVWLTAAVGMACGSGLLVLAVAVTAIHFVVVYAYTPLARRLPRSRFAVSQLQLLYQDRRGVLRQALAECTGRGFIITSLAVQRDPETRALEPGRDDQRDQPPAPAEHGVAVMMNVQGTGSITDLVSWLSDLEGVLRVAGGADEVSSD